MEDLEYKKAAINYLQNEMTYYWNTAFILGGGAFSMALTNFSIKWLLFSLGIFFSLHLFREYDKRRTELLKMINKLKEE
ncbi:MAG: hypothetical protein LBK53_06565 [Heliobacteriaceae bacterium]|jgi:hypothetical protein|nr:hypothetical protein [Heliobacteriaceae bacterium]